MDKILIKLFVPAVNAEYDLFAPSQLDIAALTKLFAEGVKDLTGGRYAVSGKELLNRRDPDCLLDPQKSLADYGLYNGCTLVLI